MKVVIRNAHILALMLLMGFAFYPTNGFAEEVGDANAEEGAAGEVPDDFQRKPQYIFGDPNFQKMVDLPRNSLDYVLGTKVAHLKIPPQDRNGNPIFSDDGFPINYVCTGFLVGPDLLMTNHHCIHDDDHIIRIEDIKVYMEYYTVGDDERSSDSSVTEILSENENLDYALLRLDSPLGDIYGWLELDTTVPGIGQEVMLISHPDGRSKEIVRDNSPIVEIPLWLRLLSARYRKYIAHRADTQGGSSGSPIFLRDSTRVIAIHHAGYPNKDGEPGFNLGTPMEHIVPEIQQWLPIGTASDLVVRDLQIQTTGTYLDPGENFTLSAIVQNFGTAISPGTTLRFYLATDHTLTDVSEVGRVTVPGLGPPTSGWSTSEHEITLSMPTDSPGTYSTRGVYYYYAGADKANNEFRTYNNYSKRVPIIVDFPPGPLDINGDGQVSVIDLLWVAIFYGIRGNGLAADVNDDGVVNVKDFRLVAAGVDAANPVSQEMEEVLLAALEQAIAVEDVAGAPMGSGTPQHLLSKDIIYSNVATVLADVRHVAETSDARLSEGVALLETFLQLLAEMRTIPQATALLSNYPNPFNPETWIPYQLSKAADVTLTIYDIHGRVVRDLDLGHQRAGIYHNRSRAAYWGGRNAQGEPVASGVYFYTLSAGDFTATRKMLIRK